MELSDIIDPDTGTIKIDGTYVDTINWMTGIGTPGGAGIVRPDIEDQGVSNTCWAISAAEICAAALRLAGVDTEKLSYKQLIDCVFPPRKVTTGVCAAALQWAKVEGLAEDRNYGEIGDNGGDVRRIRDWSLLEDEESRVLTAVGERPLLVTLVLYPALELLRGNVLLDMFTAETNYFNRKRDSPIGHSVVLIGHGVFTPTDPAYSHLRLRYWIVKNSHGRDWGQNGIGYIMQESSSRTLWNEARKGPKRKNPPTSYALTPLCAYAGNDGPAAAELLARPPISCTEDFTVTDLHSMTTSEDFSGCLVYLFYDNVQCEANHIDVRDVREIFNALGKLFKYDHDARLRLVDLREHTTAARRFRLALDTTVKLLAYTPNDFRRPQSKEFKGNFRFGEIMLWMCKDVGARIG